MSSKGIKKIHLLSLLSVGSTSKKIAFSTDAPVKALKQKYLYKNLTCTL